MKNDMKKRKCDFYKKSNSQIAAKKKILQFVLVFVD